MRDVLGWTNPVLGRFAIDEALTKSCGWVWWHQNVLAISDRPSHIHRDAQGRLHCEAGPSIAYRDGWELWHIHGVRVTEQIVMRPETLTIAQIGAENNAEVRRVMIERFGQDRYITESGMRPIAHDETYGTLYASPLNEQWPNARVIRVVNRSPEPDGTFKPYWLDVNGAHYGGDAGRIPQAAVASTWRTQAGALAFKRWQDYAPAVET
jgi:hypothetical protein